MLRLATILVLSIALLVLTGCEDKRPSDSSPVTVGQSPSVQPDIAETKSKNHPTYRVISQKIDGEVSVVVPVASSDEQLESLLWLFRLGVRSHEYSSIGITAPTTKKWGGHSYQDGLLVIYRGSKCAGEGNSTSLIGPCGRGDHSAAYYQWGFENDPEKDVGVIKLKDQDRKIFGSDDGWKLPSALQAKIDETREQQYKLQELFAVRLSERLDEIGGGFSAHLGGENALNVLVVQGEPFEFEVERNRFMNSVYPKWKKDICSVGFEGIRLKKSLLTEGTLYSTGC